MTAQDLIGATVVHCRKRQGLKALFWSRKMATLGGPDNCLYLIHRGRAAFDIGGVKFTGAPGDLVLWDTNRMTLSSLRKLPGGPLACTMIAFNLFGSGGGRVTFSGLDLPCRVRPKRPARAIRLVEQMLRFHSRKEPYYMPLCSARAVELMRLLETEKRPGRGEHTLPAALDKRIRTVLEHIEENYKQPFSLKDLAARAFMHETAFSRLFKQQVGLSPCRYVMERKIGKAMDFLALFDEGRVNTAEHLGFHDYSHFYRTFRRIAGLTPHEFVRRWKRPQPEIILQVASAVRTD